MRYLIPFLILFLLSSCTTSPVDRDLETVSRSLTGERARYRGLLARAFNAYSRKEARTARRLLSTLVGRGINHPVVLYRLAVVSAAEGKNPEAKRLFEQAWRGFEKEKLTAHRYAAWSLMGIGNVSLRQGKKKQALAQYRRALALRPDDERILTRIGWVHFRDNNHTRAIHYLRNVRKGRRGRILLGEAYIMLKRYPAAHAVLEPLYRLMKPLSSGGDARLAINYGLSLIGMAQKQAERKAYREAYRNALPSRRIFTEISRRFSRPETDPFLRRLKPDRRQYYIRRSREYLELCRQMVRKYEKYLHVR